MKLRNAVVLLIFVLTASLLFGCSPKKIERKMDAVEDSIEQQMEQTENTVEGTINPNRHTPAPDTVNITAEEAKNIALKHAGFTPEQVTGLYSEPELDDPIPHYEVQFRQGYLEYEYEINADNGDIISFEKDD